MNEWAKSAPLTLETIITQILGFHLKTLLKIAARHISTRHGSASGNAARYRPTRDIAAGG